MTKSAFYALLKSIPKSELHLHAEGIISIETVKKFLNRNKKPDSSEKVLNKLFSYNSLKEFIHSFLFIQNLFEKPEDFEILFTDVSKYLVSNGIVYCELFFAPSSFVQKGLNFEDIIDVISRKIEDIKSKYNIIIKIIIDISRTFGIQNAANNLKLVEKFRNKHIIGIGLGGDELKGPARDFKELFQTAQKSGLHTVAHAGEDDGPHSIWDALLILKAERIGHGISSIQDIKLIEYLKEHNIPLEMCVTSNLFTKKIVKKIEDHPVRKLYEKGVLVTINTDDPTFFHINIIDEYWNLYTKLDFSLEDIKCLIINGFNATFLSEKEKKDYIRKVELKWTEFIKINKAG